MANANIKAVITADDRASATLRKFGDNVEHQSNRISGAFNAIAKTAAVAVAAASTAVATAMTKAAKASWDQVGAVEQATVALKAYEKNGDKVNDVLKDLIGYARSDLGVLFNRRDLFQSAQALKIMGDNTDDLVDHVKILSRSVGLGLSNWDDLNRIVGRVGSTGRLAGDDFDNLAKAGFKLDETLRNTDITFEELFKHLDKGIPVDAMKGQANTIKGLGIRMETAFRGVGDAILGVDSNTSKFIKDGLGDKLTRGMGKVTELLKEFENVLRGNNEQVNHWINNIKEVVKQIVNYLQPKIEALWNTLKDDFIPAIVDLVKQIGPTVGAGLVWALGLAIDALNGLLSWVSDNQWAIILLAELFVAVKTAMFLKGGIEAFQKVMALVRAEAALTAGAQGLGQITTAHAGIKSLFAIPFVASLTVTAALLALGTLVAAAINAKNVIDGVMNEARRKVDETSKAATDAAKAFNKDPSDANRSSLSDAIRRDYLMRNEQAGLTGRATGGPVSQNTPYMVGERGPELFVPNKSGSIVPNHQMGGGTVNITVQAGAFMGSQQDARKYAKMIMDAYKDLMAGSGVTV